MTIINIKSSNSVTWVKEGLSFTNENVKRTHSWNGKIKQGTHQMKRNMKNIFGL